MLFGIVLQSTFIRYHHGLHVRRRRAIHRMARIQAGKHIALASRLVRIVEHASLGLLFIHRRQLAVVYAGLNTVQFCSNLSSEWALLADVVFAASNIAAHYDRLLLCHVLLRSKIPRSTLLYFGQLELLVIYQVLGNDIFSLTRERIMARTTDLHMRYRRLLCSVVRFSPIRYTQHMLLKILVHAIQSHLVVVSIAILLVHLLRSSKSIVWLAVSSLVARELRLLRLTHSSLVIAIIWIIVHSRILKTRIEQGDAAGVRRNMIH